MWFCVEFNYRRKKLAFLRPIYFCINVYALHIALQCIGMHAVASLGWVTLGAATEGVTPLFFPEKPGDLFLLIPVTHYHYRFLCFYSGVTPFRVLPHTFFTCPTSFLHYSFSKFAHKFFSLRVSPPWRVSPGVVRPSPAPPSDANACTCSLQWLGQGRINYCAGCIPWEGLPLPGAPRSTAKFFPRCFDV